MEDRYYIAVAVLEVAEDSLDVLDIFICICTIEKGIFAEVAEDYKKHSNGEGCYANRDGNNSARIELVP